MAATDITGARPLSPCNALALAQAATAETDTLAARLALSRALERRRLRTLAALRPDLSIARIARETNRSRPTIDQAARGLR